MSDPDNLIKKPASLDTIAAQLSRAIDDIESIQTKMDGLLAWRWAITGGIGLISVFALSICGFVAWSLWDDNIRLVQVESDIKITHDYPIWKADTDKRIETLEEKELATHSRSGPNGH